MSTGHDMLALQRFGQGNVNCGGCAMGIALKMALEVLGDETILSIPACCAAVSIGPFPGSALKVPTLLHAFETTGASMAGIRAALDVQGKRDVHVVGWAGDGGTYDIGLQALSGAAERNENAIYVCYDNEAYMNTGVQRSSATPAGAWTTTTPTGKTAQHPKKDIIAIMAAHQIPYAATLSVAYPEDFANKFRRATQVQGFRFLLIQSPCPTGWRMESKDAVRVARLGVESGVFPLLEVEHGRRWRVTHEPSFEGLEDYFKLQRRFETMGAEQRAAAKDHIVTDWKFLRARLTATAN